jgi:transcriptional regulator
VYNPAHFKIDDRAVADDFIDRHGFAILVTDDGGVPTASHLPLLLDRDVGERGRLVGHMARPNPQWKTFRPDRDVLAIFPGPHAYVSPSWYTVAPAVPTWNYATVHAYGLPALIEDEAAVRALLKRTVDKYEGGRPQPWTMELPEDYLKTMMRGIVAFELRLTRVETKFKLNQNRSVEDRAAVIAALRADGGADELAVAGMMAGR